MKMMIEGVNLPVRKTKGSCGYDIYCPANIMLSAGTWTKIDTGILMELGDIPEGCFGMIVPRSSMGNRYGLRLANTVGIIDSDYTIDTIKAMITVDERISNVVIEQNDRILQMVIVPYSTMPNEIMPINERIGGHGSTGR